MTVPVVHALPLCCELSKSLDELLSAVSRAFYARTDAERVLHVLPNPCGRYSTRAGGLHRIACVAFCRRRLRSWCVVRWKISDVFCAGSFWICALWLWLRFWSWLCRLLLCLFRLLLRLRLWLLLRLRLWVLQVDADRRVDELRAEDALQGFDGGLLQSDLDVHVNFDWFHFYEF